jgi:hypothetical protein
MIATAIAVYLLAQPVDAFGSLPYRWEVAIELDRFPHTPLFRFEKACEAHLAYMNRHYNGMAGRAGLWCRQQGLDYSPAPEPSDYSEKCQWVINWPKGQGGYYCSQGDCEKALNEALKTTALKGWCATVPRPQSSDGKAINAD